MFFWVSYVFLYQKKEEAKNMDFPLEKNTYEGEGIAQTGDNECNSLILYSLLITDYSEQQGRTLL